MNVFKMFPLAILVFTGFGFADLKKVDFIHTKVRGRKIVSVLREPFPPDKVEIRC